MIQLQAAPGAWRLTSAAPSPPLAGIVKEYWEVEGTLEAFRETLLPNGFVEVMFNLGPPHRLLAGPAARIWEESWFSGLQERALMIESLQGTHLVSARLHPLSARELLGPEVALAANSVVPLEQVLGGDAAALRRRLLAAGSPEERFGHLERCLSERLPARDPVPSFVHEAAARIVARHGAVRVADLHSALGVSRKHLSVTFARYAGMSAKSYACLHRFVRALDRLRRSDSVDWSVLAHEVGYSDQSHLVRDFRRVGAATPTTYLRRVSPDGTALLYEGDAAPNP
ncbi:MAG TPA: helix-turn-helix domain-containing protein [Gemmatimonadales bacterium]|nr:helix-turn-helix domain-containing protein [Gemmatimonadales bacterium]